MDKNNVFSCHIGLSNKLVQEEMYFKEVKLPFEPTVNYVLKASGLLLVIDNMIFDVDKQIFAIMMHPLEIDKETSERLQKEGWTKIIEK